MDRALRLLLIQAIDERKQTLSMNCCGFAFAMKDFCRYKFFRKQSKRTAMIILRIIVALMFCCLINPTLINSSFRKQIYQLQ